LVRAAILALTAKAFNMNGVQATTQMAAPLLVVNGPIARENRHEQRLQRARLWRSANATIGRTLSRHRLLPRRKARRQMVPTLTSRSAWTSSRRPA